MDILAAAYENPRPEVQALVPSSARRILDLGCASGALGAALKARQDVSVTGVERDHAYAVKAAALLDQVLEADLDHADLSSLGPFDCVIAADVLEHLVDPWAVLALATARLDRGGTLVVSLPNVRHWETFWHLAVKGTWPTRALGLHDRTHLRWFTLRDAYELFAGAGCELTEVTRILRLSSRRDALEAPLLARLPGRTLLTYQHVLAGRRA